MTKTDRCWSDEDRQMAQGAWHKQLKLAVHAAVQKSLNTPAHEQSHQYGLSAHTKTHRQPATATYS